MRSFEVKELARKLGLEVPQSGNDNEILAHIASQVGMDDFNGIDDIERLYSTLKDIEYNELNNNQSNLQQPESQNDIIDNTSGYNPNINNYNNQENNTKTSKNNSGQKNIDDNQDKKEDNQNQDNNKQQPNVGNGYGATRNSVINNHKINDSTKYANSNLLHNKKVEQAKKSEESTSSENKNSTGINNSLSKNQDNNSSKENIKTNPSNKLNGNGKKLLSKNSLSKASKAKEAVTNPVGLAKSATKKKLIAFIMAHPIILVFAAFFLMFLLLLFVVLGSSGTKSSASGGAGIGANCSYSNLKGVVANQTINTENLKVELMTCDSGPKSFKVIETVDFEKYVVGVAYAEVDYAPGEEEIFKTQIIAARSYTLTRNVGMCGASNDNCWVGYNAKLNVVRMRACQLDQVFADYDKDTYYDASMTAYMRYSPEINSGKIYKSKLTGEKREKILALAEEVKGKVLVDSSGNVVHTDFQQPEQTKWENLNKEGKTYEEMLEATYGSGKFNTATCTSTYDSGGTIDYGDYVLSTDKAQIIRQSLGSFLSSKGTSIDEFNGIIAKNIEKAGYGTKAGVVAAAVTLLAELSNNYNAKLPYYYGGGHGIPASVYANPNWGSSTTNALDCSAFVRWAIYNGGFNISDQTSYSYKDVGKNVSLSSSHAVAEPGDLLHRKGHIALIVAIDEKNKQYITAEANSPSSGTNFKRVPFSGATGYKPFTAAILMDEYYQNHVRSK